MTNLQMRIMNKFKDYYNDRYTVTYYGNSGMKIHSKKSDKLQALLLFKDIDNPVLRTSVLSKSRYATNVNVEFNIVDAMELMNFTNHHVVPVVLKEMDKDE